MTGLRRRSIPPRLFGGVWALLVTVRARVRRGTFVACRICTIWYIRRHIRLIYVVMRTVGVGVGVGVGAGGWEDGFMTQSRGSIVSVVGGQSAQEPRHLSTSIDKT